MYISACFCPYSRSLGSPLPLFDTSRSVVNTLIVFLVLYISSSNDEFTHLSLVPLPYSRCLPSSPYRFFLCHTALLCYSLRLSHDSTFNVHVRILGCLYHVMYSLMGFTTSFVLFYIVLRFFFLLFLLFAVVYAFVFAILLCYSFRLFLRFAFETRVVIL